MKSDPSFPDLGASIDDSIRQAIIEGRIKPGSWLREEALARDFGVSRTPLREACHRLAKEGMLDRIPRRGFRATQLDQTELEELYEVLVTLELQSIESMSEPGESLVPDLRLLKLEDQNNSRDATRYFERDLKWHSRLVAGCQNSVLIEMHREVSARLSRYFYLFWEAVDNSSGSRHDHERIEDALSAGDFELARAHLKSHRRKGMEKIREYMASKENSMANTNTEQVKH